MNNFFVSLQGLAGILIAVGIVLGLYFLFENVLTWGQKNQKNRRTSFLALFAPVIFFDLYTASLLVHHSAEIRSVYLLFSHLALLVFLVFYFFALKNNPKTPHQKRVSLFLRVPAAIFFYLYLYVVMLQSVLFIFLLQSAI